MGMVNGGTIVIQTLKKAGVTDVFALHGAHVDSMFQAAFHEGIRLVDTRHEAAAGHAAEAYARTTGKLGVAIVTAGAGFTNMLSSIANAFIDRTPVLYISGAPGLGEAETNTLQGGIDQVAMAAPITKWAAQANRAKDVPRLVAQAIRVATTAPMGPVFLNLPIDINLMPFPDDDVKIGGNLIIDSPACPPPSLVDAVRALLAEAKRPIILVGQEAMYAKAGAALQAFAEVSGIPVFSDFTAHGLIPSSHALYGGTGHKLAYVGDERPDVVLALGTRFGLFTLGNAELLFPKETKLIHVNTDGGEIGRLRSADIAIIADAKAMLESLSVDPPKPDCAAWVGTVAKARSDRRGELDVLAKDHAGPIHPWLAVSVIAAAGIDKILVADGAEAYHWLNDAVAQEHPASYLTHGHLGCMGIGLGMAIGAQVGSPHRRVLLMAGDGAIGFNISEFDTLMRHKLPVVVIVMNNHSWGASQRFQEVFPMPLKVTGTTLTGAAYDIVAQGFGCDGVFIEKIEDLAPAIEAAFASGRPTCINVRVDFAPPSPELQLMMSQPV